MRTFCIGLAAAGLLSFGSAFAAEPAEPPISNQSAVWDSVSADGISQLLTEMGGQGVQVHDNQGRKIVTFTDGPVPYNMGLALCDVRPGKCLALVMVVMMETGGTNYPLEVLNTINRENLFITVAKADANRLGFGHLVLVDGGITKKNAAINIASFIVTLQEVLKSLKGQVVAGIAPSTTQLKADATKGELKAVPADPQEMARMMDAVVKQYQTRLPTKN